VVMHHATHAACGLVLYGPRERTPAVSTCGHSQWCWDDSRGGVG
jgi:hypothetical protein